MTRLTRDSATRDWQKSFDGQNRRHHAPDGRVDRRRDAVALDQEGGRHGPAGRADLRDLDRQGRCRDPGSQRGRAGGDSGAGGSDRRGPDRGSADRDRCQRRRGGETGRTREPPPGGGTSTQRTGTLQARDSLRGSSRSGRSCAICSSQGRLRRHSAIGAAATGSSRGCQLGSSDRGDATGGNGAAETAEERLRRKSTPVVRSMAAEHKVDISAVPGTGLAGRVTKNDMLSYIEGEGGRGEAGKLPLLPSVPLPRLPASPPPRCHRHRRSHPWEGDRVEPWSRIRKLTADHMVMSRRVSPHVNTIFEIDYTRIAQIRARRRSRSTPNGA